MAALKRSHFGCDVALTPPGTALSITMGAVAVLPWTLYEAWSDGAGFPMKAAVAVCSALAVGGVLGMVALRVRSRALLSVLCSASLVVGGAHLLWWAAARSLDLSVQLRTVQVWLAASLPALGFRWLWQRAIEPRIGLRKRLRRILRGSLTLTVFALALELAERAATLVVPAVALGIISLLTLKIAPRLRSPALPLATALAAYALMWRIDPSYGAVRMLCTAVVLTMTLLALRLGWPHVRLSRWRRATDALVLSLWLGSWAACARLFTLDPALARASVSGRGISSMLFSSLQSLSDLDRDGFGVVLGQTDCAPSDASVSPDAHEIAGNGRDDNCTNGDASRLPTDFVRAQLAMNAPPRALASDAVVVVVDTFRADAVTSETPFLQDFQAQSRTFTRAYASSSFTVQSLAGMLGAQLPSALRYHWVSSHDGEPLAVPATLFGRLSGLGFRTGAVVIGGPSMLAFVRQVDVLRTESMDTSAAQTTDLALAAWRELRARGAGRHLLYVHYVALHGAPGDAARYRGLASELDGELARLWREIGSDPLWVVTGDHGEAFYEHGVAGHSTTLFVEAVHVPLFVRHASLPAAQERAVTSLLGLSPTLLALLGAPQIDARAPYWCLGQAPCGDMPAPMALEKPLSHAHGLVLGNFHVIHEPRFSRLEMYDLARDPSERTPLPLQGPAHAAFRAWQEHGFVIGPRARWLEVPVYASDRTSAILTD